MHVSYMGITSAFQADETDSSSVTCSSLSAYGVTAATLVLETSPVMGWGFKSLYAHQFMLL